MIALHFSLVLIQHPFFSAILESPVLISIFHLSSFLATFFDGLGFRVTAFGTIFLVPDGVFYLV